MSSTEEPKSKVVVLEHVIKKSDTGLVFYRKCTVDGQSYNVNNSVLLRDEGRYKLGYLLKIYCRTKGNERALVRWYFTDKDFGQHVTEQQYSHEIFATSYTGKVAASSLRKLVHVIWVANKDEIPESVPKDVYYVYRYFDHDKQGLVLHRQQLLQIRYMPKPSPDSVGSSLSVKEKPEIDLSAISFSMPYTQNGSTFYRVCTIGKDKYKIGDCVLLGDRDGSSIRRIINFSYNHENRPIAMGQFIYYQNEVTLSAEERSVMHFQEVLVSNWKRELLISNIKRKLIVIHQNIFQPVPDDALKAVYFLKRYYDPFKKKIYPLSMPLTRSDFSIVPSAMEECTLTASLSEPIKATDPVTFYRDCTLGEDKFSVGDFVTLQSGSVCVKVMKLYHDQNTAVMDINKLFTIRNVPSADRSLLSTSLLFSGEVYNKVPCTLFFEKVCVVFNTEDIVNDATFVAGDYFDAESKELYKLWKPAKLIGIEETPKPGASLRKVFTKPVESEEEEEESTEESSGTESEEEETDYTPARKRKKGKRSEGSKKERKRGLDGSRSEERAVKVKKSDKEEKVVKEQKQVDKPKKKTVEVKKEDKTESQDKGDKKEDKDEDKDSLLELLDKKVVVNGPPGDLQFSWVKVGSVKASVGDCVFVKLTEGIQLGRITEIYKEFKGRDEPVRLKLYRIYLEEEMFVSKRESASIHINEAFATDFVINALACQIDELVDVVYLKKKEKIPPQPDIPKGRLYIRRYYHPRRHLLRTLAEPLLSTDLTIIPQPHPPINGLSEENKELNRKPKVPDNWKGKVRYQSEQQEGNVNCPGEGKVTGESEKGRSSEQGHSRESGGSVAVLEPKSVLTERTRTVPTGPEKAVERSKPEHSAEQTAEQVAESAETGDLPFSGLSDLTSDDQKKETLNNLSNVSTEKKEEILAVKTTETCSANSSSVGSFNKISIVEESDVNSGTMTILPSNMISFTVSSEDNQTVSVSSDQQSIQGSIQQSMHQSIQRSIQIVQPGVDPEIISSNQSESVQLSDNQITIVPSQNVVEIVPATTSQQGVVEIIPTTQQKNFVEIVPQSVQIVPQSVEIVPHPVAKSSTANQIQIMTGDSNQVQVITDSSSIQIVPSTEVTSTSTTSSSFLPTIISSEQDLHTDMDVDITHAADGCITIAPVTSRRNNTARFEDSYTKDGRVFYRKCHFKDETILQGESVYVRCNDQNSNSEDESWKLGRVMEFYQTKYPVVRLLWFYVVEEMVTSKNERAGIHPQEVFASQCDDEIEISSIESKANVIYLQKGETIPKVTEESDLFCRRFYDPYKHSIKALKNRLSATDITILPEPAVAAKRARSSVPAPNQSTDQEIRTPNTKRKKTSPSKKSGTPLKQSPRKTLSNNPEQKPRARDSPRKHSSTAETSSMTLSTEAARQMPFFSKDSLSKTTKDIACKTTVSSSVKLSETADSSSVKLSETADSSAVKVSETTDSSAVKVSETTDSSAVEVSETADKKDDKPSSRLFFATEEEAFGVAKSEAVLCKNSEDVRLGTSTVEKTSSESTLSAPFSASPLPASPSVSSETAPITVPTTSPSETLVQQQNESAVTETSPQVASAVTSPPEVSAETDLRSKEQEVTSNTADMIPSSTDEKISENITKTPVEQSNVSEKQDVTVTTKSEDSQEVASAQIPNNLLEVKSKIVETESSEQKPDNEKSAGNDSAEKENSASDSCVTL